MERRSFLANLVAGGFGLAVGQTVEVRAVESKVDTAAGLLSIPKGVYLERVTFEPRYNTFLILKGRDYEPAGARLDVSFISDDFKKLSELSEQFTRLGL